MTATALPLATAVTDAATTEAQEKTWLTNVRAALAEIGDPLARYGAIQNLGFSLSVAGSALTIALKTRALADADANNPVSAAFRNVTPATGDFSVLNVTAASSLVVSSGSTLGTRANIPFRLWIVAFNDAGTWRPGVINCVTTVAGAGSGSDVTAIYPLSPWGIASSTAEGGAGAADSAQTFYTGTAVTAKPFVVLGYATWESGLATPGTWSAGPTRIQPFGAGVPLPQTIVQQQRIDTGAVATGSTVIPNDDTIPQNTEGDQYMAASAITASSAANVFAVRTQVILASSQAATSGLTIALFQDAIANALKAVLNNEAITHGQLTLRLDHQQLAAITTATTFKVRGGGSATGTTTFNGAAGSRQLGGVMNSYLEVVEVMG